MFALGRLFPARNVEARNGVMFHPVGGRSAGESAESRSGCDEWCECWTDCDSLVFTLLLCC
jgi:hypothetical protein